tara:strand:- start:2033 stop:2875 length:843 start_codon:yes stop_codon:yes gene_type:complete
MTNNPLKQYFRTAEIYTKLPSGTHYYTEDVVKFNDDGEVGVSPMTAKDEVLLKNPDALLNGQAISQVIASCCPDVKKPDQLLSVDVEALMIAIRHASFGDDIELDAECPKCKHKNHFSVGITQTLSTMTQLDDEYKIGTKAGLNIYVRPSTYHEVIKGYKAQFENYKIAKVLQDNTIPEEQRIKAYSEAFTNLSEINAELVCDSIVKVVIAETGDAVTEREHLREFIREMDQKVFKTISETLSKINSTGVQKEFSAKCEECDHEWKTEIDLNPVNFFTDS